MFETFSESLVFPKFHFLPGSVESSAKLYKLGGSSHIKCEDTQYLFTSEVMNYCKSLK